MAQIERWAKWFFTAGSGARAAGKFTFILPDF
jgi:hypothetical protein